jgi:uncharacterized surface protein with fasciclin (FAS1) repeats
MASVQTYSGAFDFRQMWDFTDSRPRFVSKPQYPKGSMMSTLAKNPDFSIITKIIKKARYENQLSNSQANFTLFVPSDTYLFKKYSKKYLDGIDVGGARNIINYSLMNNRLDKRLLQASPVSVLPTLNRSFPMKIVNVNGITHLPNHCNVIHWNIPSTNGIIHVIDSLLFPNGCKIN